jgi:hypothetical protein
VSKNGIAGECDNRFGDGFRILRRDEQALASMLDQFLQTTNVGGHHRLACQHRLQAGDGGGLFPRGKHEDVHDLEQRGLVAPALREHGPGLEAQIGCQPAQVPGVWTVTHQQQGKGG